MKLLRLLFLLPSLLVSGNALAAKIAVTDLAYAERVSGYFHLVDYHNKSSARSSESERERDSFESSSASSRSSYSGKSQTDYTEVESSYSYIEYGELRKFVGDIKGEILMSNWAAVGLIKIPPKTAIRCRKGKSYTLAGEKTS
jgi:hypothetical protein